MINKEISSNIYWKRTYDLLKQKRNKIHIMCNLIESELDIKLIQKRNFKHEQVNKSIRSMIIYCVKYFNLNSKFRLSFLFVSGNETPSVVIALQKIRNETRFKTVILCDLELINNELFFINGTEKYSIKNNISAIGRLLDFSKKRLNDNIEGTGINPPEFTIYRNKFNWTHFPTLLKELINLNVDKYDHNDEIHKAINVLNKIKDKANKSISKKNKIKLELYTRILDTCLKEKPNQFRKLIGEELSKEDMVNLHLSFGISTDDIY